MSDQSDGLLFVLYVFKAASQTKYNGLSVILPSQIVPNELSVASCLKGFCSRWIHAVTAEYIAWLAGVHGFN